MASDSGLPVTVGTHGAGRAAGRCSSVRRRAGVPGGQDDLEPANTDYRLTVGKRLVSLGAVAWSVPDEPHGVANESDGDLVLLVAMAPNPNV